MTGCVEVRKVAIREVRKVTPGMVEVWEAATSKRKVVDREGKSVKIDVKEVVTGNLREWEVAIKYEKAN